MKTYILIFSLTLTSCALYQDFEQAEFNWFGSGQARKKTGGPEIVTQKKEDGSELQVPEVAFEEMISKNWEYSKKKDPISGVITYEAKTISLDKNAILTIVKNDKNEAAILLTLNQGEVSYREGHSIEMILDGEKLLQLVRPSEGKSSQTLQLADGEKVCQLLQKKNVVIFELNINGTGSKNFQFDIAGLQKYFTTI